MRIRSIDVPQTDRLETVRRVVDAVVSGASMRPQVEQVTGLSERHVNYALAAARVLGLVAGDVVFAPTALGSALVDTLPGSPAEREVLAQAVTGSGTLRRLAPALLGRHEPDRRALANRVASQSGVSPETAIRRAGTLLSWRRYLRNPQAVLPLTTWASEPSPGVSPLEAELLSSPAPLTEAMVRNLLRDNPWWRGEPGMKLPAARRSFVDAIHKRLELRLAPAVVVRGPRQVGKTTAQQQVIEDLLARGVSPRSLIRVQFDDLPELRRLSEPIPRIVEWYERRVLHRSLNASAHAGSPTYLFFDEVQNLSDWAVQLKHLVDNTTTRVVVTGSSALRIEAGRDSLAGRITTIDVGTLSLREISQIRFGATIPPAPESNGLESLSRKEFWLELREHGHRHARLRDRAFEAFSEGGGYPLVHKNPTAPWPDLAAQLNETVIRRVIQHDLRVGDRGRKRDPQLLEELFRLACRYAGHAPGPALFVREIQRSLQGNVGPQRIRQYLEFLDRALLLRLVRPLELRLKRTRGEPKLCLADHGLRASWLQEVVPLSSRGLDAAPHLADLAGRIAESAVGTYFHTFDGLGVAHFPARTDEPEVDFVLTAGPVRIPVEVKFRRTIDPRSDTEGLRSFVERKAYDAPFGVLLTRDECPPVDDPRIVVLPVSTALLMR